MNYKYLSTDVETGHVTVEFTSDDGRKLVDTMCDIPLDDEVAFSSILSDRLIAWVRGLPPLTSAASSVNSTIESLKNQPQSVSLPSVADSAEV